MNYRWKVQQMLLVVSITIVFTACSVGPSGAKKSKSSDSSEAGGASSLIAYEKTVYAYARTISCIGCHKPGMPNSQTPYFVSDNVEEAHMAITAGQKIDFNAPENSRVVLRLGTDRHNCVDTMCEQWASQMLSKINEWKAMMATTDGGSSIGITTEQLSLSQTVDKEPMEEENPAGVFEAESGTITAPMAIVNDPAASGGKYIVTPNGNGGTRQANDNAAGRISYNFEVPTAGNYFLFGRVGAPTGNDNSFFVRMDNGQILEWRTDVTGANFAWDLASDQDAGGNILRFQLAAGAHTLQIRQREDGLKLDVIAVTTDMNFMGSTPGGDTKRKVLRYNLSTLVDISGAYFEIDAEVFDAFSYIFKNPTLVLPSGEVEIKGVKVLINGNFDPQTATFTEINQDVTSPGAILSGAAMIVPKVNGEDGDMISIAFEILKAKN